MKRTEDQQVRQAPLCLTFGENKEYKAKLRRINSAAEWREQAITRLESVVGTFDNASESLGAALSQGLGAALLQFPEVVSELVFSYDPELPKEEILGIASDEQMALAFSTIMEAAYPYLAPLAMSMQVVKAVRSQQASANSTSVH